MRGRCVCRPITLAVPMLAVAAFVLLACAPIAPPVAPPQVPEGGVGNALDVVPAALALEREDLPAGFQLATQESKGPEYLAIFLRPAALDPGASGGNSLLGVILTLGVYTSTTQAEAQYVAQSTNPTGNAVAGVARTSQAATDIVTEEYAGATVGADQAEAHRVTYRLMNRTVYEYAHRFRLGNVLVGIVVSAAGNPEEPVLLLRDANAIVQRQIDRIVAAAGVTETQ
jgi:hypothetical protein